MIIRYRIERNPPDRLFRYKATLYKVEDGREKVLDSESACTTKLSARFWAWRKAYRWSKWDPDHREVESKEMRLFSSYDQEELL